ncbi:helix-turn-helix transcriptional regulator [Ottowia thiooxydans]|uniref:helix-turn-helix transcriptional regulator n=1 Tax=Ottowia thiooxydans TaxID=219182 RepID=UPI000490C385|nr:YafY family protein [Ottowia thiooxydans]
MSRTTRLLDLLQLLRSHRHPVSGADLAATMGVSLRTLYRDVATLQGQGALIEGEPGIGYVLKPGFTLPPLMFTLDELEALALGSRWVARRADVPLGNAARGALAKISAVLPAELRHELESNALLVGPATAIPIPADAASADALMVQLREAIRDERKATITYCDLKSRESQRVVWPFAIGFFDQVEVLVGWCETREDIRTFRIDRITSLALSGTRYPRRRQALLKEWRAREGIQPQ